MLPKITPNDFSLYAKLYAIVSALKFLATEALLSGEHLPKNDDANATADRTTHTQTLTHRQETFTQTMDLSMPLDEHGAMHSSSEEVREESSPMSTALIIHPLSLFNKVLAPTYGQDLLLKYHLQLQEMQQLYAQQLQQRASATMDIDAVAKSRACLLEYTCDENIRSILGYLDGASLSAAQRVNRYFHQLSGDDMYWYKLCKAEWAISPDQLKTRPASYQALYKYTCQSLKVMIREFFEEQCLSSMQKSLRIPRDTALMIARRSVF